MYSKQNQLQEVYSNTSVNTGDIMFLFGECIDIFFRKNLILKYEGIVNINLLIPLSDVYLHSQYHKTLNCKGWLSWHPELIFSLLRDIIVLNPI